VVEQGHYVASPGLAAIDEMVKLEQGSRLVDPDMHLDVGGERVRWWRGGGLGLPQVTAHIIVPGRPDLHHGKVVMYRLLPDGVAATGRPALDDAVVVKVLDLLASRYSSGGRAEPDPCVAAAVLELAAVARGRGLEVVGGYECGSPASPGDSLERTMRSHRRDAELVRVPVADAMDPYSEARGKLQALGFIPSSDGWGAASFAALVAFQTMVQLVPDGVLGQITLGALRRSAPPM